MSDLTHPAQSSIGNWDIQGTEMHLNLERILDQMREVEETTTREAVIAKLRELGYIVIPPLSDAPEDA